MNRITKRIHHNGIFDPMNSILKEVSKSNLNQFFHSIEVIQKQDKARYDGLIQCYQMLENEINDNRELTELKKELQFAYQNCETNNQMLERFLGILRDDYELYRNDQSDILTLNMKLNFNINNKRIILN